MRIAFVNVAMGAVTKKARSDRSNVRLSRRESEL